MNELFKLGLTWFLGFFTAIFMWWLSRRQDAICRMRSLLLRIGHDLYHSELKSHDILQEHYFSLTDASIETAAFCRWNRRSILTLTDKIIGRTGDSEIDFHCHAFPEKDVVRKHVQQLYRLFR